MSKFVSFLFILFSLSLTAQNERVTDGNPFIKGDIIIQFEKNAEPNEVLSSAFAQFDLRLSRELSKPVNIWLAKFDAEQFTHTEVLKALNKLPEVKYAQNNHKVIMRDEVAIPNDPQYNQQWHHNNTGQSGGTVDADISSENAWEVTTGGQTAFGDDIVVCVIESADLDHVDLVDNKWVNEGESEIPNGIDDDNNGYIDDYNGWNIQQNNDNIGMPPSGHGTSVAGMIGAKGDNELGVVGANWNVKIMVVAGYSLQEAAVIEAYSYPLTMRQLYNDTNGNQGAFVVATNASWGLDGGNPDNAPIWCDFYNTLGEAGILNCGATSNSNIDVDTQGDLPTGCASPYMIGVGRADHNDNFAGGYGANTIDLVAPGINVRTTAGNNGYTTTTGTSFASPLTAGVIGLMYAVPCPSLMTIVNSNPQLGADLVREALLNSVDVKPQLQDFFITGGRLNAAAAIDYLLDNFCEDEDCLPPMNAQLQNITDTQANLSWIDFGLEESWEVHYRLEGETDWTVENITTNEFEFQNLIACASYEYFIRAVCPDVENQDNEIELFETDGCCISPEVEEIEIQAYLEQDVVITWSSILAAEGYNIRYRIEGDETWVTENDIEDLETILPNLEPCEIYEVQIQSICDEEVPEFSESFTFTSAGCDACVTLTYCESSGNNSSDEWIESFSINDHTNNSGNNGGYGDFTGTPVVYLTKGEEANISITPGFSNQIFDQYPRIWIDFNQDGEFSSDELLLDPGSPITSTFDGTIAIPDNAINGTTRMRVSLKYFSEGFFPSPPPLACGNFNFGEVEDYCVTIGTACDIEVSAIVNPIECEGELGSIQLVFENQLVEESASILWSNQSTESQITDLEEGTYHVSIIDEEGCIKNLNFEIGSEETPQADFEFTQNENLVSFTNLTELSGEDAEVEWDFGNEVTSSELNPEIMFTETGTFEVCLTITDGCGTTSYCEEITIETLSLDVFEDNNQMEIYPNPVVKEVQFNLINSEIKELHVFNLNGQKLNEVKVKQTSLKFDMSSYNAGLYFVIGLNAQGKVLSANKLIKK